MGELLVRNWGPANPLGVRRVLVSGARSAGGSSHEALAASAIERPRRSILILAMVKQNAKRPGHLSNAALGRVIEYHMGSGARRSF